MTRHCKRCDRDRVVPDEIAYNHTTCRACSRKHTLALHPIKPCRGCGSRRRRGARQSYCKTCRRSRVERQREANARWYARVKRDPVRYAQLLDTKRMESRLRLEREGRPARPVRPERYPEASKHWRIDPEPIMRAAGEWLRVCGVGQETLAARAGVSPRLIEAHMLGERTAITVDAADKIATAIGTHLDVLYGAPAGQESA